MSDAALYTLARQTLLVIGTHRLIGTIYELRKLSGESLVVLRDIVIRAQADLAVELN